MTGETGTFPDQASFLGQQPWNFPADQLVRDRLVRVGVQFVLVAHLPSSRGRSVVVGHGLDGVRILLLLRVEGVAVEVLFGSDFARTLSRVDLEDGVVRSVDVRVNSQTEQMLVIVGVDAWVDFRAPALGVLAGEQGVRVENASEFDLELDGSVLVEDPVYAVLIVGSGKDVADDQFPGAGDHGGLEVVTEITVLEENTGVFLVDTDGVLDGDGRAGLVHEFGIHVVDATLAVAA